MLKEDADKEMSSSEEEEKPGSANTLPVPMKSAEKSTKRKPLKDDSDDSEKSSEEHDVGEFVEFERGDDSEQNSDDEEEDSDDEATESESESESSEEAKYKKTRKGRKENQKVTIFRQNDDERLSEYEKNEQETKEKRMQHQLEYSRFKY